MIEINDCYRLRRYKNMWNVELWQLEEWQPTTYGPQGRWKAISGKLSHEAMTSLLEQRKCSGKAMAAFKAVAV